MQHLVEAGRSKPLSRQTIMPVQAETQTDQPAVLRVDALAAASSSKGQRIPALDFTKGVLVLLIVLYHWVNYFIGQQWPYYRYLRFLTPSFLFIAGFMISHVYLSKYAAADPRLPKRLFTRGVKLLAIFIALNVARNLVVPVLGTGSSIQNLVSLQNVFSVFISGNLPVVGNKLVSFSILVPISYVLMLSGLLMLPYRIYRHTFHLTCALLLSSILVLRLAGAQSYHLEFLAIGMLGVLIGFMPVRRMNDFGRHPYLLALAYLCYLITITIWNVPFLLLIVGVLLNLVVIYIVGSGASVPGAVMNEVILLGKYSLLGYISQVAILQVLSVVLRHVNLRFAALTLSFIAAFVLTIVSVEVVDRGRAKFKNVDRLYKAVFA